MPSSSSTALPSPTSSSSSECLPARRKPRVTAEHTLNRVRENQRRHRARRKDYIASLEEKLAQTEAQLADARREIEALKREREASLVAAPSPHSRKDSAVSEEACATTESTVDVSPRTSSEPDDINVIARPDVASPSFLGSFYMIDTLPSPIPLDIPLTTGPPPCCEDEPPDALPLDPSDPECSSCKTRPPPSPSESTTLCAQAYVMIQQQNFRGIDATTIRLWLYQGYRRAQREGEGCRVENGALFRLLDYISGV